MEDDVGVGVVLLGGIGVDSIKMELLEMRFKEELWDGACRVDGGVDDTGMEIELIDVGFESTGEVGIALEGVDCDGEAEFGMGGIADDIAEEALELGGKAGVDDLETCSDNELDSGVELDRSELDGAAELDAWVEDDDSMGLDNIIEPDNAARLDEGDGKNGAKELEVDTELENVVELDWLAELDIGIELEENTKLDASTEVEVKAELDIGTVLESRDKLDAETELGWKEDRDTPMPFPRIDDCACAVLRMMLDSAAVGLL